MVDPYQPAEERERMMPRILDVLLETPPRVFVLQTRGPMILRDLEQLRALTRRTTLRVSFSITTNREEIRKLYEPHCAPIAERLDVIRALRNAGIETYATLAPFAAVRSRRTGAACSRSQRPRPDRRSLAHSQRQAARRDHSRRGVPGERRQPSPAVVRCGVPGRSSGTHPSRSPLARTRLRHRTLRVCDIGSMKLLEHILGRNHSGACGQTWIENPGGGELVSFNPSDGSELGRVRLAVEEDYDEVLWAATKTFERWRLLPAPQRGEIVREIGDELRAAKDELGALVTLEMGKILAEGKGEVQEMIDIADFATGLSRQLYGLSMHSERPGHRMYEQWHPLGVVGVISAFNFPVAVWSWNALIAMVCGDTVVWKPSPKTPLTAIAVQVICNRVLERRGWQGVLNLVIGRDDVVGSA